MEEGPNIRRVAEDMVRQLGTSAYPYLCEQAEIAMLQGDRESAITWLDIALAVIEIQSDFVAPGNRSSPLSRAPGAHGVTAPLAAD